MRRRDAMRTAVDSSVLSSIGYAVDETLELEFRGGAIYRYFAVPQTIFQGLIAAESKGA